MKARIESVAVVGLGKVGLLVGLLMHHSGREVIAVDLDPPHDLPFPSTRVDAGDPHAIGQVLDRVDAVVSCLPGERNVALAQAAIDTATHYFDLTELVDVSSKVRSLGEHAGSVVAPQCGLAPGFIAIAGAALTRGFEQLRSIELRVGALPRNPTGLLGYAFNWSPEGVVAEYLHDCNVIRGGRRATVPAMGDLESVVIDGVHLEAFSTSGGLGTMCDTFDGRTEALNYKTLRYPGHCELMRFFFDELYMRKRAVEAGEILVHAKPPVDSDVVYVHAAVEGWRSGDLAREEFVRRYEPRDIAGRRWRAIAWTTAASVSAVVELVSSGALPAAGVIRQEDIGLDDFLATEPGSLFA